MNNRCLLFIFIVLLPGFVRAQIDDSLQRKVFLEGAVNARDLGGYRGAEGKHVIWGKIYSSADISKLTQKMLMSFQCQPGKVCCFTARRERTAPA